MDKKAKWGQRVPEHPDVDLCDLRNVLRHHIRGYVTPDYRDGVMYALRQINERIEYNELNRERKFRDEMARDK